MLDPSTQNAKLTESGVQRENNFDEDLFTQGL